jgi:poly-gamma-glutamate synthesis protein (capsule biosynthesis protein)
VAVESARGRVILTGDIILDVPGPAHWLSGIAPALRAAALAIGHLEVPHTLRGEELHGDVPAPGADPSHLAALPEAGFGLLTLAGNHMADRGAEGIADTCAGLDALKLAHCGAGADLAGARRAAVAQAGGLRLAVLSYNLVGPENGWASTVRPGVAYLPVATADGSPVRPNAPLQALAPEAAALLQEDIAAARGRADRVIVALHKGIVHTPARLAPYERAAAAAAVQAGADLVVSHHAHLLRGLEFIDGVPVFHGLGNGCVVTTALSPAQDHPARAAWVERRKALFGFEPDPAYVYAPFHPDAVNAVLAVAEWPTPAASPRVGIIPVHVEAPGRPVLAEGARAQAIVDYFLLITRQAGLPPLMAQGPASSAAGEVWWLN